MRGLCPRPASCNFHQARARLPRVVVAVVANGDGAQAASGEWRERDVDLAIASAGAIATAPARAQLKLPAETNLTHDASFAATVLHDNGCSDATLLHALFRITCFATFRGTQHDVLERTVFTVPRTVTHATAHTNTKNTQCSPLQAAYVRLCTEHTGCNTLRNT